MKIRAVAIVLGAGLGTCLSAQADTIVLKNHRVFEGKIVEHTGSRVTLEVGKAGTVTFRLREIESIRKDGEDGSRLVERALEQGVAVHREPRPAPTPSIAPPRGTVAQGGRVAPPIAPSTRQEIADDVTRLGTTRERTGKGFHRDEAIVDLVRIGAPAVPDLVNALSYMPNWFTRSNAARALEEMALGQRDPALELALWRAVPPLVSAVGDPERWVRVNANGALVAITGQRISTVDTSAAGTNVPDVPPGAVELWNGWWNASGGQTLADLEREQGATGEGAPEPHETRALPAGAGAAGTTTVGSLPAEAGGGLPNAPVGRQPETVDQPMEAGGGGAGQ